MNIRNIKRQWLLMKHGPEYEGTKMAVDNIKTDRNITGVFLQSNNVMYVEDIDEDGYRIIGLEDNKPIRFEINALCRKIYCRGNMTVVGNVDKAVCCEDIIVDGTVHKYCCLNESISKPELKVYTYQEGHRLDLEYKRSMGISSDNSKVYQVIEIDGDLDYLLIDNVPNVDIIVDIKTPAEYKDEPISEIICEGKLAIRGDVVKAVAGSSVIASSLLTELEVDTRDIIQNHLVSAFRKMSKISEEIVRLCFGTFSDTYLDNDTEYTQRLKKIKKFDDDYDWRKIKAKLTRFQRY